MVVVAVLSMFVAGSAMAEESLISKLMSGGSSGGGFARETSINGMIDFADNMTTGMIFLREGRYIDPTTVISLNLLDVISDSGTTTSNMMMLGLGAKKYLGQPAKSAMVPFLLGSAGISFMSSTTDTTTTNPFTGATTTTSTSSFDTGFSYQLGGGLAQFINENVSMDGDLQYYSNSIGGFTSSGVRLSLGMTVRY